MIEKAQISNFLRVNDIPASAPANKIREALIGAGWDKEDVEVALLKLQGSPTPYQDDLERPNNGLYTNKPISPSTLTSLLGMDVSVAHARTRAEQRRRQNSDVVSTPLILMTVFTSVVLGLFVTLLIMYMYNVGPFYSPVENYIF